MINSSQILKEVLAQVKGLDIVKCELCEELNNLNIHHIDLDHTNNKIANLILLCRECHLKTHGGFFGKSSKKRKSKEERNKIDQARHKKWRERNKEKFNGYYRERYRKNRKNKILHSERWLKERSLRHID